MTANGGICLLISHNRMIESGEKIEGKDKSEQSEKKAENKREREEKGNKCKTSIRSESITQWLKRPRREHQAEIVCAQ
jgi:hypothetical protein